MIERKSLHREERRRKGGSGEEGKGREGLLREYWIGPYSTAQRTDLKVARMSPSPERAILPVSLFEAFIARSHIVV